MLLNHLFDLNGAAFAFAFVSAASDVPFRHCSLLISYLYSYFYRHSIPITEEKEERKK